MVTRFDDRETGEKLTVAPYSYIPRPSDIPKRDTTRHVCAVIVAWLENEHDTAPIMQQFFIMRVFNCR